MVEAQRRAELHQALELQPLLHEEICTLFHGTLADGAQRIVGHQDDLLRRASLSGSFQDPESMAFGQEQVDDGEIPVQPPLANPAHRLVLRLDDRYVVTHIGHQQLEHERALCGIVFHKKHLHLQVTRSRRSGARIQVLETSGSARKRD